MSVDLLEDELLRFPEPGATGTGSLKEAVPPLPEPAPSVSGPCQICGERPASVRCVNCAKTVCRQHHWAMFGLCKGCADDDEVRRGRETRPNPPPDLGIKWIEE